MPLYLSLLVFSVLIPFVLSFDKKVRFYGIWKSLFPSVIIVGAVYITADIIFARYGIWGFNPEYHSNIILLGLPLEEWLFFILIPYACIFIHYVFISYYPDLMLSDRFAKHLSAFLIIILVIVLLIHPGKTYTFFNFSLLILSLVMALVDKAKLLNRYFISFLIILIPFFIVNGILTGTFIKDEVVWYNSEEIIGLKLLTVPVEDIGYAFSLILLNLLVINKLQKLAEQRKNI
jgi:lycopene cyclase domain-containing protein